MSNEINLFGVIGRGEDGRGITAQQIKTLLAKADQTQPLIVRIDSEGGSVFEGFSIYEAFAKYPGPKKAIVESTAFSIASYIAMAFDEVEIAENGYMMIHEPYGEVDGTSTELMKHADLLAKLDQSMVMAYARKTGLSEEEARALMIDETYMNASEAMSWGFVDSVSNAKVQTRIKPQAKHQKLPQRVFTALFGAGSADGPPSESTKEKPMSTANPVAASVKEIKAAFPKMKAEFVLKCLEKELPLAQVATQAAEELMAENAGLEEQCAQFATKLAAMEEELVALKAKAAEEPEEEMPEEEVAKAKAEEEEEAKAKATAKARGVRPVARAAKPQGKSATQAWHEAVDACTAKAPNRMKAVAMANKQNPGLRERMLAEANVN